MYLRSGDNLTATRKPPASSGRRAASHALMNSSDLASLCLRSSLTTPRHLAGEDKAPAPRGRDGTSAQALLASTGNIWPTRNTQREASPAASASSLARSSTKPVLSDSDTKLDGKLEAALFRTIMSGSAGPCSPELLSWATEQLRKAADNDMRLAVDSTFSDQGSHGERAQSRRSARLRHLGEDQLSRCRTR